jgi:hypothetical protein
MAATPASTVRDEGNGVLAGGSPAAVVMKGICQALSRRTVTWVPTQDSPEARRGNRIHHHGSRGVADRGRPRHWSRGSPASGGLADVRPSGQIPLIPNHAGRPR